MVQDRFNAMCIFNCQQLLIMLKKKTQIGNTMFKTYLSLPACIIHLTKVIRCVIYHWLQIRARPSGL